MYYVLLFYCFLGASQAANILGFFVVPSFSHQIIYQPIWKELALRGHNVTVITPEPIKDKSIKNLREIDIHDISYAIWNKYNLSVPDETGDSTDLSTFFKAMVELMDTQLANLEVKDIIQNKNNDKFDLFIVEHLFAHAYPLKQIYNCPMVAVTSMPIQYTGNDYIGNPAHPIISPELNLPYGKTLNFKERVMSVLYYIASRSVQYKFQSVYMNIKSKHYPDNIGSFDQLSKEISIVFTNFNPILHTVRPSVPAVKEFSGIHIKPPKDLPLDLKIIMDGAKEGVIYIAFGSSIKSSGLPKENVNMLLEAFSELPYKILWKYEADGLKNIPKNVIVRNWLPQQDVLRHPNLKLFVTQGGLQSIDEAMYSKVPMVIMPIMRDQHGNAKKAEEAGIGKVVNLHSLSKESFKETVLEVLKNKKYKIRSEEVCRILTDVKEPPLENIIWWIEYVLRHNGAAHLRSATIDMPFYQYFMLDVFALLAFVVFSTITLIVIVVKCTIGLCKSKKKVKTQ